MATDVELSRLADMTHALRPDWPARSVRTLLERRLRDRAYADLAVALAVVACDPTSETAARLEQPGPWWQATRANRPGSSTYTPGPAGAACRRAGHEHEPADGCRCCRAEQLAGDEHVSTVRRNARTVPVPAGWRDRAAERVEAHRILTRTDLAIRALRVPHGVVEVDPLDAVPPTTDDPGPAGVETREDAP